MNRVQEVLLYRIFMFDNTFIIIQGGALNIHENVSLSAINLSRFIAKNFAIIENMLSRSNIMKYI